MYNKLILACLFASFSLSFPYYGDGGEKVAFSLISAVILISLLFKPVRKISLLLPILFVGLITWQCGQATEIHVRMSYMNLLLAVVAVALISERFDLSLKTFGIFIFVFILANSTLLMAQVFGVTHYLITDVYPNPTGFLQFPWVMGILAALSIPFIWAFSPFGVIATLPMIFYSHSLVSAVAAFLSVMYLSVGGRSFLILTGVGIVSLVLFLLFSDRNIDERRFIIWKQAIFYSKDQIFGNGLGTWAHTGFRNNVNGSNMWWRWAHNEPYQVAFENGIAGLSLMLAYFVHLVRVNERRLKCFVLSLGCLMLFHPVFHSGKLAMFLIVCIALVEAQKCQSRQMQLN